MNRQFIKTMGTWAGVRRSEDFFINNSWWLVSLITFVLLIIHTFSISDIKIDNITLALLLLLLISPFISQIKKIKWGELEAEIDPKKKYKRLKM